METLTLTKHAKDRYVQRAVLENELVDAEGKLINIDRYVALNEERINKEVAKLLSSCEHVYTGAVKGAMKDHNTTRFFINKNGWCLVLDKSENTVITMYKIDLELGDEQFNTEFIAKSIDYIKGVINDVEEAELETKKENAELNSTISDNEAQIKELNIQINALKNTNQMLDSQIKLNNDKTQLLQSKVYNAVTLLIAKDKGRV